MQYVGNFIFILRVFQYTALKTKLKYPQKLNIHRSDDEDKTRQHISQDFESLWNILGVGKAQNYWTFC
jgi:hypothetical protein